MIGVLGLVRTPRVWVSPGVLWIWNAANDQKWVAEWLLCMLCSGVLWATASTEEL